MRPSTLLYLKKTRKLAKRIWLCPLAKRVKCKVGAPTGVFAKQETAAGGGGGGGGEAIETSPFWLESLIPLVASGFSIVFLLV